MKKSMTAVFTAAILLAVSCNDEKKSGESSTDSTTNMTVKDQTTVPQDTMVVSQTVLATSSDGMFATEAAQGGMAEVKLGELARTNGTAAVKDLADMMVKDHSAGNDELKAWAAKVNYSLPATISDEQQKSYDKLAAKKGSDFDKAYADAMVEDHEMDIKKFKDEATNGMNADLKAWANGKLATLQHHLDMAKETKKNVK